MRKQVRGEINIRARTRPPGRFVTSTMGPVMRAVNALNESLLDRLSVHARDTSLAFPLAASLRARIAALTSHQISAISRCGVLLSDIESSNPDFWQHVNLSEQAPPATIATSAWLTVDEAISHTLAVMLGCLYILRTAPTLAQLVLGMQPAVLSVFGELSERTLLATALRYPHLLQPRWSRRPDIWITVLDFVDGHSSTDLPQLNLHCLKLAAACSSRLQPPLNRQSRGDR